MDDRVLEAFRNCITEPKCRNCPWTECEELNNRKVEIPIDLALAVNRLLYSSKPIKPVNDLFGHLCGECGRTLEKNDKYCRHCGKEILWG